MFPEEPWFAEGFGGPLSEEQRHVRQVVDGCREQLPQKEGELHFHDLRHTAISLQAKAGIPAEVIAERVGHTDGGALIRRRYRHLYPGEAASHMAKLDSLIREARQPAAKDVGGTA